MVVERNARYDDRPRVSLVGLFRLAKTAMFSFSTLPLSIFHVIGATAMAVFLGVSGYSLFCKLFTNLAIPGWTSYVLIGSFFGALNALGISILGEYVIRIYDQVRGRPLYLVDRTVNMETGTGAVVVDDMAGDRPYRGVDGGGRVAFAAGRHRRVRGFCGRQQRRQQRRERRRCPAGALADRSRRRVSRREGNSVPPALPVLTASAPEGW